MKKLKHSVEVVDIHKRIFKEASVQGRSIEIGGGYRIHVIEAGIGYPLVYLHGGGAAAHTFLPVLEHLEGFRVIVPDRPGNGLSDPIHVKRKDYKDMAIRVTDQILDAVGMDRIALVGSSGGGIWAIWYALAHPERINRLVLLGSAPLLPGTYCPWPHRLMATPIIGDIMARIPSNEKMIVRFMGMMGEKETIVRYPMLIKGVAAGDNDPIASKATRAEITAFVNLSGFRTNMKIRSNDLANLKMPTLVIWGDHDPLGGADVARTVCEAIPNCTLELLPAGHVPYLGYPEKSAQLIMDFVLSR